MRNKSKRTDLTDDALYEETKKLQICTSHEYDIANISLVCPPRNMIVGSSRFDLFASSVNSHAHTNWNTEKNLGQQLFHILFTFLSFITSAYVHLYIYVRMAFVNEMLHSADCS